MPFPPAERVIFENNPLEAVVTQLRFPAILRIAAEEPAGFQDHIRSAYPLYSRDNTVVVPPELEPVLEKFGRPPQSIRHTFRTVDQKQAVFLSRGFLGYEENGYQRWERFRTEVERALHALIEEYSPVFLSRIGLRYINLIRRSALGFGLDRPWHELVKPAFIGLLGLDEYRERVKESTTVSVLRLDDVPGGNVRIQHGIRPATSEDSEECYSIDADFFTEERTNVTDALSRLDTFHAHSGNLFRWTISDTLYQALRPHPVDSATNPAAVRRAAGH